MSGGAKCWSTMTGARCRMGSMVMQRQSEEVDRNYDAFMRVLAEILPEHRDEYALMRDGEMTGAETYCRWY